MILDKYVDVIIINHNINHYKEFGYNVKYKDKINVKPEELTSGSHVKINCKCDKCGNEKQIKYQDYLVVYNKHSKYFCSECRKISFSKLNNTKKEIMKKNRINGVKDKYDVDNVFQLDFVKSKIKDTFVNNYGYEHFRQCSTVKEKEKKNRIKNGSQIPDDKLSDFEKYKKSVLYYTRKNIKKLYDKWNGLDYYDNELIIDNYKFNCNDNLYPNIDHKISIKTGFIKNIKPIIIGNVDNLCITKRINNLSKGSKYEIPKRLE